MSPRPLRIALAALLVLALSFAFQGTRGLFSTDEGRYTAVALNMLDSGDWLTPRLHPQVEHFSKPPLTYWAIAASLGLFGASEWAVRAPNALAFALTVLLVYLIGRRLRPERAGWAAAAYLSLWLPYAAANFVGTDTLLAALETVAAYGLIRALTAARPDALAAALFWGGLGLAFLTKGPPALLGPLALVLAAVTLAPDVLPRAGRLLRPWGPALGLLIAAPWFVWAMARHPALVEYFLREEVVQRIASDVHRRDPGWRGLFVVYVPTLLIGALPWWPLLLRRAWQRRGAGLAQWRARPEIWLPAVWLLLPLAVFFLAQSRMPLYLLPLFAPLALLTAQALPARWLAQPRRPLALLALWMAALVALRYAPAWFEFRKDDRALAHALRQAVPERVEEIVFVDDVARFGLRFYLDLPIAKATLAGPGDRYTQPLREELREGGGCRLFVVERKRLQAWVAWTTRHRYPVLARGGTERLVFFVAGDGSCQDADAGAWSRYHLHPSLPRS